MIEDSRGLTSKAVPLLVILILSTGCIGGVFGDGASSTPEEDQASGEDQRPSPGVSFGQTKRQNNNSGFALEGAFRFNLLPGDNRTFDDVVVCLYDESGSILYENTRSVTGPVEWKNYSIRINKTPTYMIVDHPEFSEIEEFSNSYIYLDVKEDSVTASRRYTYSDLPFEYPRHNETGRCR